MANLIERTTSQWISVGKELPKEGDKVLIKASNGIIYTAMLELECYKTWYIVSPFGKYYTQSEAELEITSWMPIPE